MITFGSHYRKRIRTHYSATIKPPIFITSLKMDGVIEIYFQYVRADYTESIIVVVGFLSQLEFLSLLLYPHDSCHIDSLT